MPILGINPVDIGVVGVKPQIKLIDTNDTLATVITTGYLNNAQQNAANFAEYDMCLVSTKTSPNAASTQVAWLEVSKSGDDWSLVPSGSPGQVVLPTVANYIAHATNTTGTLSTASANVINPGNISAGLSGTAETLSSFPATASKGSLKLVGVANSGNTDVTISNASHAQASVYSIPDVGAATGQFNVVTGALVSGNLPIFSGTAGKLADSGAKLYAGTTGTYAGGGTSNAFTVTGLTASAKGSAVIRASTNAVSIVKAVPGTNTLTVDFSADPGAGTTVDYIYSSATLS